MRRRDVCEIVERNDTGLALKRKGTGEELPGGCVVLMAGGVRRHGPVH